jgi:hypothetical protein
MGCRRNRLTLVWYAGDKLIITLTWARLRRKRSVERSVEPSPLHLVILSSFKEKL